VHTSIDAAEAGRGAQRSADGAAIEWIKNANFEIGMQMSSSNSRTLTPRSAASSNAFNSTRPTLSFLMR
jgi:hypothetical protein